MNGAYKLTRELTISSLGTRANVPCKNRPDPIFNWFWELTFSEDRRAECSMQQLHKLLVEWIDGRMVASWLCSSCPRFQFRLPKTCSHEFSERAWSIRSSQVISPTCKPITLNVEISSLHAASASSAAVFNHLFHLDCRAAHCKQTRGQGPLCTRAKSRDPWNCESPKEKCPKAVPTHLQNHVVWSRTLRCSVKPYVTGPSTTCYFDEFLVMRVLTHDQIEPTNGCECSECHGLPV